jgi:predicted SAM-dependent methyltransferase
MKLNLGCGSDYRQGYINVDRVSGVADVVHDLNVFPYPWSDNSVDEIVARHILEHLEDSSLDKPETGSVTAHIWD